MDKMIVNTGLYAQHLAVMEIQRDWMNKIYKHGGTRKKKKKKTTKAHRMPMSWAIPFLVLASTGL